MLPAQTREGTLWLFMDYFSVFDLILKCIKMWSAVLIHVCGPLIPCPTLCADISALFVSSHIKRIKCKAGLFPPRIWYWYRPSSTSARCMRPGSRVVVDMLPQSSWVVGREGTQIHANQRRGTKGENVAPRPRPVGSICSSQDFAFVQSCNNAWLTPRHNVL